MTLQKLIHLDWDINTDDNENVILVHGVNEITNGGEYTICGRAIPDSVLQNEGWAAIEESYQGSIKKIECKDCLRIIHYFKRLK